MRVFVTGGSGYIGSVTVARLADAGHEVVVFDNLERGHRQAIDARAVFVKGDLRDPESIQAAMSDARPDAVMHFAAYALVGESMADPGYFRNNVSGGVNLAEAMLLCGVRVIVFSSTCATYGHPGSGAITEETPQRPVNPYGESKLACERILDWYAALRQFRVVHLRYFNASGATERHGEDHDPETHLIPLVLKVALGQRDCVRIFGDDYDTPDGTCLRDYVHIVDLADAHLLALCSKVSGAFNLGSGSGYSVREVVEVARRVTGLAIPAEVAPRREGDPARLVASPGKAARVLGWAPRFDDLTLIVRSAWQWHRAHPRGYEQA